MGKLLKPKVLGDIKCGSRNNSWDAYSTLPERVNLHPIGGYDTNVIVKSLKILLAASGLVFFVLGSATAPTFFSKASSDAATSTDPAALRTALEAQLKDLEGQINQYEDQVSGYQKQGKSLSGEIKILNGKIAKVNLQIQAVNLTLKELDQKIVDTQSQIKVTQDNIETHKAALSDLVRNVYEAD